MKLIRLQITPWDKDYIYSFDEERLELGDKVVVRPDNIMDIGTIVEFLSDSEYANKAEATASARPDNSNVETDKDASANLDKIETIDRKATADDIRKSYELNSQESITKAFGECRALIKKHDLPMKLVDVRFSLDSTKVTFAFIAEGRVDFRELLKDLTRIHNRTIRLQQIGIRDEAKFMGDYGHCGRNLCCKKFLKDLKSITSEMAELQQCVHRGSDRISGVCGRLMCCLSYEDKGYRELAAKFPPIGTKVKVEGKVGTICGHNILKKSIKVEMPGEKNEGYTIVEISIKK